jgi:hypothetical protein
VALLGADPATAVALEPRNSPAPLISCCGSALPPLSRPKLCAHSDQAPGTASKSQAATRIDQQFERGGTGGRLAADHASGDLHVLFADRVDDIPGGEPARGHLVRIQPHAHGVVAGPEQLDLPDAREPGEDILQPLALLLREVDRTVGGVALAFGPGLAAEGFRFRTVT